MRRGGLAAALALAVAVSACGRAPAPERARARSGVAAAAGPAITVTPGRGLADGDVVRVEARGFAPGLAVGITQCADLGADTGAGDCDLGRVQVATADGRGRVRATYTVRAGPFGDNRRVCSAAQPCVLSVGEATTDRDAPRAVAPIRFG